MSHQVQLSPAASHRPTAVLDPARHATEPPACRSRCPYSPAGNAPDTVPPWKSDLHGHLSHALGASGASGPGRCSRKVTTRRDLPTHTPADLYASDCSAPGWWWRPERAICRTRHFRVPQRDQRLAQCVVVRVRIPRHGFATARSDPCRRGLVASNRGRRGTRAAADPPGYAPVESETSTTISISTDIPNGSSAMPTADLACLPRSPKISISKSDAPFITAGCCSKPGAELTMPSTLTIRVILSRSPVSAFTLAKQFSMTSRAAARGPGCPGRDASLRSPAHWDRCAPPRTRPTCPGCG